MRPRSSTFAICLEKRHIIEQMLEGMNQVLTNKGVVLKEGISLDASILHAPSSTKNKRKERDPEIHSVAESKQRIPRFSETGLEGGSRACPMGTTWWWPTPSTVGMEGCAQPWQNRTSKACPGFVPVSSSAHPPRLSLKTQCFR